MGKDSAFVGNNGNQYFIRSVSDAKEYIIQYVNGIIEKNEVEFSNV